MIGRFARAATPMALVAGVALGWSFGGGRPAVVRADGGDRSGESILTTGVVALEFDKVKQMNIAKEAVYFLDYQGGRLLATVPGIQQTPGQVRVLGDFAERDLIADFGVPRNLEPHFAMTTGSIGEHGDTWAPVYVVETVTKQIAVYRVVEQRTVTSSRPKFELLERRPFGRSQLPPAG